jgi:hypothetical protein
MISLRKTRNNKNSPRKKSGTKKRASQKRKNISLEKLKQEIEQSILEKLKQNGPHIQEENKNKPKSGHAIAGETWDQSEAGKKWKDEIDVAQKELDTMLQQEGYAMSASGKYARELASQKRKNPDQSFEISQKIVKKIIDNKGKQYEHPFKQPKPVSPVKLIQNNMEDMQPPHQPLIGGFFEDDSSDEE